jgi:hypothetical protein
MKIPAFARKYNLPCSACHTIWPELNSFGQAFKDRGYQLGNDRDSPIFQNPSYFPLAVRTTPNWHYESTTHQPVDVTPGDSASGLVERTLHQSGFDLTGIDFLMLGTVYKDITVGLTPTMNSVGAFHIETAYIRFDNLGSPWVNVKMGKFELDNLLSEKRIVLLSNNGGFYQSYHYKPVGDANDFGLGDNQLGVELMGHNSNSYTRYTVSVLSSVSGSPGVPAGSGYDAAVTASQAFDVGGQGPLRVGLYGYLGQRPTVMQTTGGAGIAGTATNNKTFYRVGLTGSIFLGSLELLPFYLHGSDNAFLATGTAGNQALPDGARDAVWNAGLLEAHYIVHPQLVFIGRYEGIRVSRQPLVSTPKTLGNVDAMSAGIRAYPFMFSRAGLALHGEYSLSRTIGAVPLSGTGAGVPPLAPGTGVWSSSVMLALDFAF